MKTWPWVFALALAFAIVQGVYYPHWFPQSGTEVLCDGIGALLYAIAMLTCAVEKRHG
jgi:hypothetical protein